MFPVESLRTTVGKIARILRQHEIPFHLTGGATTVAYSEPRFTQDIDIVIRNDAAKRRLPSLLAALEQSDFIFDPSVVSTAIESKDMFQLFDSIESLKLDIYARELIIGELDRSEMAEIFEGERLPIVSRADAVVSKLIWINKGSHKSRQDLKKIHRRCSDSDLQLIQQLTDQLNLNELLQTVLAEPDEFG